MLVFKKHVHFCGFTYGFKKCRSKRSDLKSPNISEKGPQPPSRVTGKFPLCFYSLSNPVLPLPDLESIPLMFIGSGAIESLMAIYTAVTMKYSIHFKNVPIWIVSHPPGNTSEEAPPLLMGTFSRKPAHASKKINIVPLGITGDYGLVGCVSGQENHHFTIGIDNMEEY